MQRSRSPIVPLSAAIFSIRSSSSELLAPRMHPSLHLSRAKHTRINPFIKRLREAIRHSQGERTGHIRAFSADITGKSPCQIAPAYQALKLSNRPLKSAQQPQRPKTTYRVELRLQALYAEEVFSGWVEKTACPVSIS